MTERVVKPEGRGFLFLDSHPVGCAQVVRDMAAEVEQRPAERRTALVIGSSSGYGLATTIAGLARYGIDGIGICFEKAATARRTATAGWYRTAETSALAAQLGRSWTFVNADAFADTTKEEVLDLIASQLGGIDHLVYSVAAPRRTDPRTGETYQSVLKAIGAEHTTKSLAFDDGAPVLQEVGIEVATDDEIAQTVKVMGGEDWKLWIDALSAAGVLADGFKTVAYSYIGPELTWAIYTDGTIGRAKLHLEQTARELNAAYGADTAVVSVNKALVTQASSAIPGVPLYISILYKIMKAKGTHEGCIEQIQRLFADHYGAANGPVLDDKGRIRIDDWEMRPEVQEEVEKVWNVITTEQLDELSDFAGYQKEFLKLFGFGLAGVDYAAEAEPVRPVASIG